MKLLSLVLLSFSLLFSLGALTSETEIDQLDEADWQKIYNENLKVVEVSPKPFLSEKHIKKIFYQRIKQSPAADFIDEDSLVLTFMAQVFLDEKALPQLMKLMERRDELKRYLWISLAIFILLFLYGFLRRYLRPKESWLKRFLVLTALRMLALVGLLYYFYHQFSAELAPTWSIAKKVFWS